jgi:hypothetical protein
MKIHNIPQHTICGEDAEAINCAVANWKQMSHEERKAFIDSINIYTNPEWIDVRAGKFTASRASEFLADSRTKGEVIGDSCKTLCHRVMAEQTGWREERNIYMEFASIRRGLVFEPIARKLAEEKLGETITECGFVEDDLFGCSPDGLIMKDGKINAVIEIKCPEPMAFYKQLMDCAKEEYKRQMQFAMNVCDCPRAYFVLFCPEVSDQVYVLRYTRGIAYQSKINARKIEVAQYMQTVQEQVASGDINIPTLE